MAHSEVFFDGVKYSVFVSHPLEAKHEDSLVSEDGSFRLYGLIEYSVQEGVDELTALDIDEGEVFTLNENWSGIDKDAVLELLDALSFGVPGKADRNYFGILKRYEDTKDPEFALNGYPVGTVIRVDYGNVGAPGDADVLIKRDVDLWALSGVPGTITEEELHDVDYEVIYDV